MAQWLRAFPALTENIGLAPSTGDIAPNHMHHQFQGILHSLLVTMGTKNTYGAHIDMQANTYTCTISIFKCILL